MCVEKTEPLQKVAAREERATLCSSLQSILQQHYCLVTDDAAVSAVDGGGGGCQPANSRREDGTQEGEEANREKWVLHHTLCPVPKLSTANE